MDPRKPARPARREPAVGDRVGHYELVRRIGEGGMGVVFEARDPRLGRTVALKMIVGARGSLDVVEARFAREAEALARLRHPGIVAVHEIGQHQGDPFFVMELIAGRGLDEVLEAGPLDPRRAVAIVCEAARAIHHAHEHGVIHRDVKPSNIMLEDGEDERVRLLDFGLARPIDGEKLTETGAFLGTPLYSAPEQLRGRADERSDVYGLGAVLYRAIAGRDPYEGSTLFELVGRVSAGLARPPSAYREGIAPDLDAICLRALALEPSARYESALALALDLERFLSGGAIASRPRRRIALVALAALAGLSALVAFAIALRRPSKSEPVSPQVPAWYGALGATQRPRVPLPPGVQFGSGSGEYRNVADGSVLVFVAGHDDVEPFFAGKYLVTVEQFESFVRATGYSTTAETRGTGSVLTNGGAEGENPEFWSPVEKASWRSPRWPAAQPPRDHPVTQVSWYDARAYCEWAKLHLLTEAEWEAAALWDPKSHRSRAFPWGEEAPRQGTRRRANLRGLATGDPRSGPTSPVGAYPEGASPCGALDMVGCVWEWCEDGFDERAPRASGPLRAPAHLPTRVARGGSYATASLDGGGDALRIGLAPGASVESVGFRVARLAAPAALRVTLDEPRAGAVLFGKERVVVSGRVHGPASSVAIVASGVVSSAIPIPVDRHGRFRARAPSGAPQVSVRAVGLEGAVAVAEQKVTWTAKQPDWFLALHDDSKPELPARLTATSRPGEYENEVDGSILVFVPATMIPRVIEGSNRTAVFTITPCFIGKFEVTNAEFAAFVLATGYLTTAERGEGGSVLDPRGHRDPKTGRDWKRLRAATWRSPAGDGRSAPPDHPVVHVTRADAEAYCRWAELRLPTEMEWETAALVDAHATENRTYPWGNDRPSHTSKLLANFTDASFKREFPDWAYTAFGDYDDGYARTAPVGSFPAGASPVGALDMAGNVWEWCEDGYDATYFDREDTPGLNPVRSIEGLTSGVVRGGGWRQAVEVSGTRYRGSNAFDEPRDDLGFRVACSASR